MTEGAWLLFLLTTLATPLGPTVEVTATRHTTESRCEQEKKRVTRPGVVARCERDRKQAEMDRREMAP